MLGACARGARPAGEIAGQRELLSRLRAVVEAKDAENAVLRRELDAERELRRRLELRLAELERRLRWTARTRGRRRRRSGSGRKRRGGRGSSRSGSGARTASGAGSPGTRARACSGTRTRASRKDAEPPAECRRCRAAPGRRGGRGLAVGAGHRRGGHPEGDRVGAAGPDVPVLRDGHVRGAAAGRARGLGVLRAGAERGRGAADRATGTCRRSGPRSVMAMLLGVPVSAGLGGQGRRPAGGAAGEGRVRRGDARGAGRPRTCWPPTRPR